MLRPWRRRQKIIEIDALSKDYKQTEAIKNLNLTIEEDRVFGLIGTNGAGKSTLLRMIAGILRPLGISLLMACQFMTIQPQRKSFASFQMTPTSSQMPQRSLWPGITRRFTRTLTKNVLPDCWRTFA